MSQRSSTASSAPPAARAPADELDEITLRRAQAGAAPACRALVECYGGRVLALATRMLAGDRSGAEDIAQETFLHVFAQLERFSPLGPARLSTWILTIATRRAIDELRRRGHDPARAEAVAEPALPSGGPNPEQDAHTRALARAAMTALGQLAPEVRAALLLREVHELEYTEIARILKLELGTVKSRISRGRAVLRHHLQELQRE